MNKQAVLITILVPLLIVGILIFASSQNSIESKQNLLKEQLQNEAVESSPTAGSNNLVQDLPMKNIKQYPSPPELIIEEGKTYKAKLITSEGDIILELNTAQTPRTANNFIFLAKDGFYNDTIFHRVINGFMIQGGDPKGNGTGGPGYRFDDEEFEGEYTRGTIAMANAGPNTNGSQFFIMHQDYPLPPNYVIFGKVTEGLEIVDKIAGAETTYSPNGEKSTPVNPVMVQEVLILE